ncbi:unnamed protein product [Brassicogethes aeneus]|uniref:C2H2-type domain-containing protein n=1 Tax=Brassicogethes aeneus TaxID=1431903 RepID=A0A9P0AWA8_BRAAE|nr:unnamed protein product [Brassicogethes aeneus]
MEQMVVKKELIDDFECNISINNDKPSTFADQEMPLTSGIAVKQEIKEALDDSDHYDELGVKEKSETSTNEKDDFTRAKQAELKFKSKDEVLVNKGITLPQRYLNIPAHNFGSKIPDSHEKSGNYNDESKDFSSNIKEEERASDFFQHNKNEEKDEDEVMFEPKIEMEYHGVEYYESGTNSEVVNKDIQAIIGLTKAGKEIGNTPESRNGRVEDIVDCVYECTHCLVQFFDKEIGLKHEKKCSKPNVRADKVKLFECELCSKKYPTKKVLFDHKKYVHRRDELEKFKCDQCHYETAQKGGFNRHLRMHNRKNFLKCNFC